MVESLVMRNEKVLFGGVCLEEIPDFLEAGLVDVIGRVEHVDLQLAAHRVDEVGPEFVA